jgi:DNA repair protein RecN (Recombination protein N)
VIRTLRVRNLAVIEELELELGPGLNVLTGETGAGKSVLLGAIGLLCGRRVGSELIRSGADQASVEAIIDAPTPLERARAAGLASSDAEELLVVRTLASSGRGRVLVNGSLCTVGLLAELVGEAIEVVSQGQHQRLLRPEVQAELLDRFGGLEPELAEVGELHQRWCELAREIRARHADAESRARREDQLRFEIAQIDEVDPGPGELDALEAERSRLRNVDRLAQSTAEALEALAGEDAARDRLAQAQGRLEPLLELDAALAPIPEALARAQVELDDASAALQRYAADLEADPARLEQLEQRGADLQRLQRRYGPSVEAILEHRDRAREELERIGGGAQRTAELEAGLESLGQQLHDAASKLGKARRDAAGALEARVASELRALDLRGAQFEVRFEEGRAHSPDGLEPPSGSRGAERASFLLAANPGEEARRLRDAASGGELARLLLALQNVLRDEDERRMLLFDEVDAGIGGRTARRVGERLLSLAGAHQVLCITHLPQVAALGDVHYRIQKRVRKGRTFTAVEPLSGELRVEEIARMSGGGRVSDAARAHARELLGASGHS